MSENQDFVFDKFIDDIVKREDASKRSEPPQHEQNTPQREYIRRYRELPQNRTKWE